MLVIWLAIHKLQSARCAGPVISRGHEANEAEVLFVPKLSATDRAAYCPECSLCLSREWYRRACYVGRVIHDRSTPSRFCLIVGNDEEGANLFQAQKSGNHQELDVIALVAWQSIPLREMSMGYI